MNEERLNDNDIKNLSLVNFHQVNLVGNTKLQTASGKANGTFGELLQGFLPNGKSFMVTFPINLFSYVTFIPDLTNHSIETFPHHKTKSKLLAYKLLALLKIEIGGKLIINSELPEGKGLASSSADLVATAYAISKATGISINAELIAKLISEIEPSDGIMYEGIVSFYYKELKLIKSIGRLNNLLVVAIDEGGQIDTLEYNKREKICKLEDAISYEFMLNSITNAIKSKNLKMLGDISTQSAIMNQRYNPKKFLDKCIELCTTINGLGVTIAHSGTFLGILLDNNNPEFIFQRKECIKKLKEFNGKVKIISSI